MYGQAAPQPVLLNYNDRAQLQQRLHKRGAIPLDSINGGFAGAMGISQ
jgi:hypothetical protein